MGSLRARIVLLVAMVAVPAIVALWVISDAHHDDARAAAEARIAQLAIGVAGEQRRVLTASARLLNALTTSTALALGYRDACGFLLTAFNREYDILEGLQVLEGDEVWCESGDADIAAAVRDMAAPTIQRGRQGKRVSAGPAVLVGTTPYLPIAVPFTASNPDGRGGYEGSVERELVAVIKLGGFEEIASQYGLDEEGGLIVLFDHDGRLLVRHPRRDEYLGRTAVEAARGISEYFTEIPVVVEDVSFDGTRRVHAALRLEVGPGFDYPFAVVAALPLDRIFADANRVRQDGILHLLGIALVIVLLSSLITQWFLRRDIAPLIELTEQLGDGNLPTEGKAYSGPTEFVRLRDAMVASAQARTISDSRLQSALQRLDTYFRNSPMAFLELDPQFRIRLWTPQAEALFGWKQDEAVGKTIIDLGMVHEGDIAQVEDMLRQVVQAGGYVVNHHRNLTRGGRVVWCEWHTSMLVGEHGQVESILCIAMDETVRVMASKQHERQEEEYRLLFMANPAPMWVFDSETFRFLAVNDAAVRRYGWSESEFLSMKLTDIRSAAENERLRSWLSGSKVRTLKNAGIWMHKDKAGTEFPVEVTSDDIVWQGQPARIVVVHDVTDRERTRAHLQQMMEGALTLARIGEDPLRRVPVDLTRMTTGIVDDLLKSGQKMRDAQVDIEPNMTAQADPELLRVALTHLLSNALKFSCERTTARIKVGSERVDGTVVYYVRDNGIGFEPESADLLFEITAPVKGPSGGIRAGIGLATVKRIIRHHGGRVWAVGQPDEGATVHFTLSDG